MERTLPEFIDELSLETTDGKEKVARTAFKNFYVSNHGIGLASIKERMQKRDDSRTLATPRVLGFLNEDLEYTEVGNLLFKKCLDHKRILFNQYKKWHWINVVNFKSDAAKFDIYPYWIILEFLALAKKKGIDYISSKEYMAFVSVIRHRRVLQEHLRLLEYARNNPTEEKEFYNAIPDKDNFFLRFSKSGFHEFLKDCLEYITYDEDEERVYLTNNDIDFLLAQVDYFYKKYDHFIDYRAGADYFDFLRKNFIDNILNIFPMAEKKVTKEAIAAMSGAIKNSYSYKNILLKGVPGTGKSKMIEDIMRNDIFGLKDDAKPDECLSLSDLINHNVIRINVHSGLSNTELMQGIGVVTTKTSEIKYHEKQGLILEHIARAILNPSLPYIVILEEIQENSLNRLIGDLIFLIEEKRRVKFTDDYPEMIFGQIDYQFVSNLTLNKAEDNKTKLPSLVEMGKEIFLCIPENLYIFCSSNYRDDKKIMEDNLMRRFDVIELFPNEDAVTNSKAKLFFEELNKAIIEVMLTKSENHPDHYLCGHVIWMDVNNTETFSRALNKVIIDFKDIKEIDWRTFKEIIEKTSLGTPTEATYKEMIENLQNCFYFKKGDKKGIVSKIDAFLK